MDDINEASNDSITGNISEENNISMGFNGTLRVGFGCCGGITFMLPIVLGKIII